MRKAWQRLSVDELHEIWRCWRDGVTFDAIEAQLGIPRDSAYSVIVRSGGVAPRERRRSARTLSLAEREEISRSLARGETVRAVARRLTRAPSTISREIRRHGGRGQYRATRADARAWRSARRPKARRLATKAGLRRVVFARVRADWSPEQIAAWLRMTYPADPAMHVSHETIYRALYVQARGALKQELIRHLRRRRPLRQSRAGSRARHTWHGQGQILGAVSIAARPPAVEDRAVPGHWEGDLLAGTQHSHIVTLVERRSRYVMLARLAGRDSDQVVDALIRRVRRLPQGLMQSLTWDRGTEMAQHRQFSIATDVEMSFCDPRSPWQRGSNENTNGLLRQYFPKGTDLRRVSQRQLDLVAKKLNTRPRER
ncbi:MAG TPA: IS30 family transposase [Vicinamibacterales bacterium]|nr:IS30 family transposase [Vicinamibacterales bacterium]